MYKLALQHHACLAISRVRPADDQNFYMEWERRAVTADAARLTYAAASTCVPSLHSNKMFSNDILSDSVGVYQCTPRDSYAHCAYVSQYAISLETEEGTRKIRAMKEKM